MARIYQEQTMKCVVAALVCLVHSASGHAQDLLIESEQADLRVSTIVTGLEYPWSVVFLPDGDMLISERPGRLRYIDEGVLREEAITGLPRSIYNEAQGGLLGLALHPDFADNRLVYFSFAEGSRSANHTALARARLGDDGRSLTNVETLFRVTFEKERGYHFGGRILFQDDGTLMLTLGEGSRYRSEAQNLNNHLGTIVRLNDDGSVPFDNPYVSAFSARPEIYTYGHRNVQGIARNPMTGSVWTHEHGPRGGDEINILGSGLNYGWPRVSYGINYDGTPVSERSSQDGYEEPIWYWVPSIAPSGMSFYQGEAFAEWDGDLFVGALAGQQLVRFEVVDDRVISEEILLADQNNRIRDVQTGPDGLIYLLTDAVNGQLLRLEPSRQ
jgi:glucose/arabinose dehydrogenase